MMIRICRSFAVPAVIGLFALSAAPARAFDTGPHFDLTRDALTAEGFGDVPIRVTQINNWFCDLYEQDDRNAYSGHQAWNSKSAVLTNLITLFRKENWSEALVKAAEKLHFDSSTPIDDYAQARNEWLRLAARTREILRELARRNDLEGMLAVMGMTLHGVQDFYTHSNWVEPQGERRLIGGSGPGWAARSSFGSHPTFFDIHEDVRSKEDIYSRKLPGEWKPSEPRPPAPVIVSPSTNPSNPNPPGGTTVTSTPRPSSPSRLEAIKKKFPFFRDAQGREIRDHRQVVGHGGWNTPDRGDHPEITMNKDTANRPLYVQAYTTAYIASRQWIQAMRSWIGDEALWARLQRYATGRTSDLSRDERGAFLLSWHVGHWNGNEGRKSNFADIGRAGITYFEPGRTFWRRKFESLCTEIVKPPVTQEPAPVPSSRNIALNTSFVIVRVSRLHQIEETIDIDPGTSADYYMDAYIGGQKFKSSIINGADTFDFKPPYAPFTFIKAVPSTAPSLPIKLQLWDDDFLTDSDKADIGPRNGSKDVDFLYNVKSGAYTGDVNGSGRVKVRGRGDDDVAEIIFNVETMLVSPPGIPLPDRFQHINPNLKFFELKSK